MIGDDPDVPYPVRGAMPQPGFFIEDLNSGVSFCHLGANQKPYPEMEAIRGRLDILFLHVGRMSPGDEAEAFKADGASLRRTCGMATRNRVIRR